MVTSGFVSKNCVREGKLASSDRRDNTNLRLARHNLSNITKRTRLRTYREFSKLAAPVKMITVAPLSTTCPNCPNCNLVHIGHTVHMSSPGFAPSRGHLSRTSGLADLKCPVPLRAISPRLPR